MAASRFFAPLLLTAFALASCQRQANDKGAPSDAAADAAAPAAQVPCALAGGTAFHGDCLVERTVSAGGLMLVIHHPDGGFRRLLVATDGRGVVTADGSEPASVSVVDPATIEVTVGGDRYRLPATVKGQELPAK